MTTSNPSEEQRVTPEAKVSVAGIEPTAPHEQQVAAATEAGKVQAAETRSNAVSTTNHSIHVAAATEDSAEQAKALEATTATEAAPAPEGIPGPDVVIITGMSGAGRTEAMHTFEDLGYFCIDNLPPALIMNMISLASVPGQTDMARKLAIVCDARNREYFKQLVGELTNIKQAGITFRVIFLDAADATLIARYKASRRRHPLCMNNSRSISEAITYERRLTQELREIADSYIDTTNLKPRDLRERLRKLYSKATEKDGMNVTVYSFGFKHGAPTDADIVIDVRFLPNPFYVPELRSLTGLDQPVASYVLNNPETHAFLQAWQTLLNCVMPGYVVEGKQQLAIGVGCTGGQHRSVVLAEKTAELLRAQDYNVRAYHRDIALADTNAAAAK